jgi:hypothetical protein
MSRHGQILHKMLNIDCFYSKCQVCQMKKKKRACKKYWMILPKIAESDGTSLGYGLCGSDVSIKSKEKSKSKSLLVLTMIDPEINPRLISNFQSQNKSVTFIQDLFHNSWLARYPRPQFIVKYNETTSLTIRIGRIQT